MRSCENHAESCPHCGAPSAGGGACCPRCGGTFPRAGARWVQPAFERVWEQSGLRRPFRLLSGAGETVVALYLSPARSFRTFRRSGPLGPPFAFGVLLGAPCLLLDLAAKVMFPGGPFTGLRPPAWLLAVLVVALPVYSYLRAHVLYFAMLLFDRNRHPFTTTFRLVSYVHGTAALLLLVPVAGDFLFLAAGAVLEIFALEHGHGLSLRDGALLELAPAILLGLSLAAVGVLGVLWWSFVSR